MYTLLAVVIMNGQLMFQEVSLHPTITECIVAAAVTGKETEEISFVCLEAI